MLHLRISSPAELTEAVVAILRDEPAVSSLAVLDGASLRPAGDVVLADVAREGTDHVLRRLRDLGVHREGAVHVEPAQTWLSQRGLEAERRTPGSPSDSVVWAEVTQRAYDDSELSWTYLSFATLATLLAGIAIVLDSQILVIGAMVLGPEFGAVAGLGLALLRRRRGLLRRSALALTAGFGVAITVTTLATLAGRALGWVTRADVVGHRPGTDFIYTPDRWSAVVAVVAAAAGVLSLTSTRTGGLAGVFISVTTVPAAGNIGVAAAFGAGPEVRGSALQLLVNVTAMAVAGWATLALQGALWSRVPGISAGRDGRARRRGPDPAGSAPGSPAP